MKIPKQLESLIEMGVISEVIQPLMSGKEAQVYMVRYNNHVCVVKVYKEANNRSFRQRTVYSEGRTTRSGRDRRAMEKQSRYGKELQEDNWKNTEVEMLYRLHNAGVRVPRPHDYFDGVLIMEMVQGHDSQPAPRLSEVDMSEEVTLKVYHMVLKQVVLMLRSGVVHGDLSEYNILLAVDGPVIIDFPQAVNAAVNQNSKKLFIRDLQNFTNSLAKYAPALKHTQYPQEIWALYESSKLKADTILTGIWKDNRKNANVSVILQEIEDARQDHLRKQKREKV